VLKGVWKMVMPITVGTQAAVTQAQFGSGWGRKIEVTATAKCSLEDENVYGSTIKFIWEG
jgi:hypothetical protein